MSYPLTDDQQLMRQDAADFAKQYLEPAAVNLDKTGEYPTAIINEMAQHDFFGLFLPENLGGAGAGYLSYVLVVEALAGTSAAISSILVNHASLACYAINKWGNEEQKKKYLPQMAAGTLLGGFAFSEDGPALGIGPHPLIATPTADGFSLTGTKPLVANAGVAGVYVVFGCIHPVGPATKPTAFIVDAKTPGVTVGPGVSNMGLHGRPTADLNFKNAAVSSSQVLGAANQGDAIAKETMAVASVAEAAETVGIAQSAVELAAKYAQQRIQFRKPIAAFDAVQTLLADVATNCHLARLAIHDAAALIENGKPFANEAAMVKSFASRIGLESLIDAVQVEGGIGYSEDMPLARLFRDVAGTTLRDAPDNFPERLIAANIC